MPNGRLVPVELFIVRFLPAVRVQALAEIALRIHEADADEGKAEIAGLLAVIAGQDSESTAINGDGIVKAELR